MPFAEDLLHWYDRHARALPWRGPGVSPYATWVSEVMLQQTRVESAGPYFQRWMSRFPTVEALADAPLDEVLAAWSGLGYYSRARNLHAAAREVVAQGGFPTDRAGLQALPGVGPYISAAVASIAFGRDEAAIDGNLERVLARVHRHPGGRAEAEGLARALLPPGRAGDFNQALMDLGSTVCTPRSPGCDRCPVLDHCGAGQDGDPTRYPSPRVKRVAPEREAVAGAWRRGGRALLARRPDAGLFGGLYELPGLIFDEPPGVVDADERRAQLAAAWSEGLGLRASVGVELGQVQHTLTHMRLTLRIFDVEAEGEPTPTRWTATAWAGPPEAGALGLATFTKKALAVAFSGQVGLFG